MWSVNRTAAHPPAWRNHEGSTKMRTITDMGMAHGKQTFHVTGNPTVRDLIEEGIIIAIPDPHEGIIYKRPEKCTPLELAARLTVEEAEIITAAWNAKLDQESP